jgi:hypothetical protein
MLVLHRFLRESTRPGLSQTPKPAGKHAISKAGAELTACRVALLYYGSPGVIQHPSLCTCITHTVHGEICMNDGPQSMSASSKRCDPQQHDCSYNEHAQCSPSCSAGLLLCNPQRQKHDLQQLRAAWRPCKEVSRRAVCAVLGSSLLLRDAQKHRLCSTMNRVYIDTIKRICVSAELLAQPVHSSTAVTADRKVWHVPRLLVPDAWREFLQLVRFVYAFN